MPIFTTNTGAPEVLLTRVEIKNYPILFCLYNFDRLSYRSSTGSGTDICIELGGCAPICFATGQAELFYACSTYRKQTFLFREDSVNVTPMININKKDSITFYLNPNSIIANSYAVILFIALKLF
jgi:hypothetical protein